MTSNRRRKQKAQSLGLTDAELQLCELLGQVIELLRWNQVLGYSNQYLLHEKLGIAPDERHRVMRAAAQAVEQDGRLQDWGRRLLEVQDALRAIHERMNGNGTGDGNGTGVVHGPGAAAADVAPRERGAGGAEAAAGG